MRITLLLLTAILLASPIMAAVQNDGGVRVMRVKLVTDEEFKQFHLDGENYARGIISSVSDIFEKTGKVRLIVTDAVEWMSPNDARDILEMVNTLKDQVPLGSADMVICFIAQPPGALEIASRQVEGGIGSIFEPYILVREPQGVRECLVESTAHEVGHAFGLQHVDDASSFMRPASAPTPVLTLDKDNTEVFQLTRTADFAKGMDSLPQSSLDKLVALYQKLARALPGDQGPFFALSLIAERNMRQALAKAKDAVAKSPVDADALRNLAVLSSQAGDYAESEKDYRSVLQKQPDDAEAHCGLGLALLHQAKLQEAEKELREAVRLKPGVGEMHSNLATALRQIGRNDEAVREYREAIRLKPDLSAAHSNLSMLLADQGKLDEAAQECEKVVSLDPGSADAHADYALVLIHMNRLNDAMKQAQEAIRIDPGCVSAHESLAHILRAQGKSEEAILEYRFVIRADPEKVQTRMDLGGLLTQMGKLDDALTEYKSAMQYAADAATAAELENHIGTTYARQGKMEEAIREFHEAVRLKPDYPYPHNGLGIVYAQRDQIDDAIKEFQEAVRIQPDFAISHGGLAMAYYTKKQYADAWTEAHLCLKYGGKISPDFRKALTEAMPEPSQ